MRLILIQFLPNIVKFMEPQYLTLSTVEVVELWTQWNEYNSTDMQDIQKIPSDKCSEMSGLWSVDMQQPILLDWLSNE